MPNGVLWPDEWNIRKWSEQQKDWIADYREQVQWQLQNNQDVVWRTENLFIWRPSENPRS